MEALEGNEGKIEREWESEWGKRQGWGRSLIDQMSGVKREISKVRGYISDLSPSQVLLALSPLLQTEVINPNHGIWFQVFLSGLMFNCSWWWFREAWRVRREDDRSRGMHLTYCSSDRISIRPVVAVTHTLDWLVTCTRCYSTNYQGDRILWPTFRLPSSTTAHSVDLCTRFLDILCCWSPSPFSPFSPSSGTSSPHPFRPIKRLRSETVVTSENVFIALRRFQSKE